MMKSTIKLFRAVPITEKQTKVASEKLLASTIRRGFVFSPEVIHNYSEQQLYDLIKIVEKEIGLTPEKMNNSFQKSWKKVREASMMQLVIEQSIHYFTTYGLESLGIYNESSLYIPYANLDIPELTEDVKFTVIKGYTREELREKLLALLESGIAMSEDTRKDVVDVAVFVELSENDVHAIKNKEVRTALYDYFGLVPEQPVEFLRYAIFKTTGNTLLIKNKETIESVKTGVVGNAEIVKMFRTYDKSHGKERLAEIFYRFKPLFLAFRENDNMKPIINKLRKLADKYHKPMKNDLLNDITSMISRGEAIDESILKKELERVSTARKIRVAQALNYRNQDDLRAIVYKVRNGKSYAKKFSVTNTEQINFVLDIILDSIVSDIKKNVDNKKVYIPDGIDYAIPSTLKQFTGNLPSATCVTLPRDAIMGIHWENFDDVRVDIDLSLHTVGLSLGWNNTWRTDTALYSGDNTSAPKPHGASELYYLNGVSESDESEYYIMTANYFSFSSANGRPVPMKILIAHEKPDVRFEGNNKYMVNPNNVMCVSKTELDVKQKILGLVVVTPENIKFYFNESNQGRSIVSSGNEHVLLSRQYLFDYCTNSISLNQILERAGAILVDKREEAEIDLSPEVLEKDTIVSLLY